MFSLGQVLIGPQNAFRGWRLYVRCKRCQRQQQVNIPPQPHRTVLLANYVARLRCRDCRERPSGVMLTNCREYAPHPTWLNKETRKGPLWVVLWQEEAPVQQPRHDAARETW